QDRQLYQERFIHSEIYKARPNVHSVIHAHTPSVLTFSVSSTPLRAVNFTARFLIGGVPTFEIREVEGARAYVVNDRRIAASLVPALGDRPVALMRGHGMVVVGPSVQETVERAIYLDINARVQAQAMALGGTVKYLEPQDAEPAATNPAGTITSGQLRSWNYWKQRAMGK